MSAPAPAAAAAAPVPAVDGASGVATLPTGALSGVERAASDMLEDALRQKNLFVLVGAGVTLSSVSAEVQKKLGWVSLIESALDWWAVLQPHEETRIQLYRQLLQKGDFMMAALAFKKAITSADWASWLKNTFSKLTAVDTSLYEFLRLLQQRGARILTTNYDTLIEKHAHMSELDASVEAAVHAFFTSAEPQVQPQVFHVHGSWTNPQHVVFDLLDYQRVTAQGSSSGGDYHVQQRMRQLLTTHSVLFIGCGGTLADPHFTALLQYASELNRNTPNRHVQLSPGVPRPGEPRYLSVQRLNQGSYNQLLPSLRNLFPSLQALPVASPSVELCELFPTDLSEVSVPVEFVSAAVKTLQQSPGTYPADHAVFVTRRMDEPLRYLLNMAAPTVLRWHICEESELQGKFSVAVFDAMKGLLAHAKHWKQQDRQIQRLVVVQTVTGDHEGWPELSYFLLRCPLNLAAVGAAAASNSAASVDPHPFQVFNHAGPLDVSSYIREELAREIIDKMAFPLYRDDPRDVSAIVRYLESHGVDMEGFDETSNASRNQIQKAKEFLHRCCASTRVFSEETSYALKGSCERWREGPGCATYVHNSAMKIALVAQGFRVACAGADKINLKATVKQIC